MLQMFSEFANHAVARLVRKRAKDKVGISRCEDTDTGLYIGSSDRLKLLANPFGTKMNTSSNNTIVLVYLCDVPNGLADNFNFSDDPMSVPVSRSSNKEI